MKIRVDIEEVNYDSKEDRHLVAYLRTDLNVPPLDEEPLERRRPFHSCVIALSDIEGAPSGEYEEMFEVLMKLNPLVNNAAEGLLGVICSEMFQRGIEYANAKNR